MNVPEFQRRVERMVDRGISRDTIADHMARVMRRSWGITPWGNGWCVLAPSGARMQTHETKEQAAEAATIKQREEDASTASLVDEWLTEFCDLIA